MPRLEELNKMGAEQAEAAFLECCGSKQWAKKLIQLRPFHHREDLFRKADDIWFSLSKENWLEAFLLHPRIGDRKAKGWASREQAGLSRAAEKTLLALQKGNIEYEKKFGHVFLVCATGKSADEMLTILQRRIINSPDEELKNAGLEQAKITKIRLQKLLDGEK
jgi:2-oxo-4-hydroxy-4-carboxy-5-ureidoimidazoline decarboxylase